MKRSIENGHTYPSEPVEITFEEWLKGFLFNNLQL